MKRIIDIDEDYYEILKFNVENGQKYKPWEIIANSTPYEERPQGDWINRKHYQVDEDGYDTMTCNKCGKEIDLPRMEDYYFCPICGAKMKKENPDERIT